MSNIAFVLGTSIGSFNSSLKLAKDLVDRGHQVCYITLADSEDRVRANGLDVAIVYKAWYPKGTAHNFNEIGSLAGCAGIKARRGLAIRHWKFLEAILNGQENGFQDTIEKLKPDLMIHIHAGALMVVPALLAYSLGTKAIYLRDMLGRSEHPGVPPVWTDIIPSGPLSRLRTYLAWRKSGSLRHYWMAYGQLAYRADVDGMIRKVAVKCGYPWSLVDKSGIPPYTPRLLELVLCPKEFDFPHAEKPGRYYVEASIDVDRDEPPFRWELLNGTSPLVYCALGTLTWFPQSRYRAFYQAVIDASRSRPDWQWVVAVGDSLSVQEFRGVPSNVILVNRAPQLQLLKRARLMITHGGTNTIKECIYFGVPMVVYPLGYDHPGNTARVIYHGLGVKGNFLKVSTEQVRTLVDRVDGDPYYGMQARLMQAQFREAEDAQLSVKLIGAMLRERTDSSAASPVGPKMVLDVKKRERELC